MREIAAINQDATRLTRGDQSPGWVQSLFMGSESRGERIGSAAIASLLPELTKPLMAADCYEQEQRNLEIAFVLVAYQRDRGHFPAKLEELTPKYLNKVPEDLFSGKPLIYRLHDTSCLLYSVGPNGADDDGRGRDDEPPGDDLSVRIRGC